MINLYTPSVDLYRIQHPINGWGDPFCGSFLFASPVDNKPLRVIASSVGGWDHVSISRADRIPDWHEMEFIYRRFFLPDEVAMQLHVPAVDHINCHPFCLHLWRPYEGGAIPRPPHWMVGFKHNEASEQFDLFKSE